MESRVLYAGLSVPKKRYKIGSILIRWAEFQRNKNPLSWFNLYHSSHVFSAHPAHQNRKFYMVNHASGHIIHWLSQPNWEALNEVTRLYKFVIPIDIYYKVKNYAEFTSGNHYAFEENIGIALSRFWFWITGKRMKNPFGTGEAEQKCSEFLIRNLVLELVDWETLKFGVVSERGYEMYSDIDMIGVRDMEEVFEWLSSNGYCYKVSVEDRMVV